jgi:hypothetical protein
MDTEYNSEYLVPLRCTQIALWATSGIRGTLCEIPANQETRHPWR